MIDIFLLILIFSFNNFFLNLIIIHINVSLLRLTNILLILNCYMILHLFSILFANLNILNFSILTHIRLLSIIFLIIRHLLSIGSIVSILKTINWYLLILEIIFLVICKILSLTSLFFNLIFIVSIF